MGFLRRLLGGGDGSRDDQARAAETGAGRTTPGDDVEEQARDLDLLRAEQDRLDELVLRQQRYADRSWTPPPQGGTRRSDDSEAGPTEGR